MAAYRDTRRALRMLFDVLRTCAQVFEILTGEDPPQTARHSRLGLSLTTKGHTPEWSLCLCPRKCWTM